MYHDPLLSSARKPFYSSGQIWEVLSPDGARRERARPFQRTIRLAAYNPETGRCTGGAHASDPDARGRKEVSRGRR